jgi:hypothetical protein
LNLPEKNRRGRGQGSKERSTETSSLLYELFRTFREEMHTMPDALEEFTRETIDRFLKELPLQQRLEGLSAQQILEGLSPEERQVLLQLLQASGTPSKPA